MAIVRTLTLAAISFVVSLAFTPFLTNFLYRHRAVFGKQIREGSQTPLYSALHKAKAGTPTMGGVLIWGSTILVTLFLWILAKSDSFPLLESLNFLDRGQTYLPLGMLLFAALFGLLDDALGVIKIGSGSGGGIKFRWKLLIYFVVAAVGGWWFFYKLEWDLLYVPFIGYFNIGIWYLPIFISILLATIISANETDGLDGLLGGVALFALGSLAVVSFAQGRFHLAAFLAVIIGSLLAFLWFNIYPARFFMGDTGAITLGATIGVVAMLTNSALFLPFFAFIFVLESASVIVQLFWKRVFGRKLFLSTPIHHHFEALGWPEPKVVMRFWIISAVVAGIGLVLYFASVNLTS
ncbi:MAG: hypothetical protein HY001_03145 [Candidatus Portnoybacteria bacterium]|nr:hypothetical protein [Candidatus Portnoybacteria bacterium]